MSLAKSIVRRFARGVARQVARHELFEKPGERAPTAPLPDPVAEPVAEPIRKSAGKAQPSRLVGAADLSHALTPRGRPLVVHHWATWCEPCAEELPRVEALARALGSDADVVGVSWELFDSQEAPDQALETVSAYAAGLGLSWPTLVFRDAPEALFQALELEFQKIPQTRVLSADGTCLEELQRPLEDADIQRLASLVCS